jgi:hypothetical protein
VLNGGEPPNGWRQPRAGGLARTFPSGKAVDHIPVQKIAASPASRLHAVLGRIDGRWPLRVMIACLQEIDAAVLHHIDETMLLRDAP